MKNSRSSGPGSVRVIGGQWRGTRLAVADAAGLRPTGDRARETLFNWLMPMLPGVQVLDAFAGSGALGLEALSRGAASAVLIERDAAQARLLGDAITRLRAQEVATLVNGDALAWLRAQTPGPRFDLVFMDPPFAANLWEAAFEAVLPLLKPEAWLYLEMPKDSAFTPPGWDVHRELSTRETTCWLLRRRATDTLKADLEAPNA